MPSFNPLTHYGEATSICNRDNVKLSQNMEQVDCLLCRARIKSQFLTARKVWRGEKENKS